MHSFVTQAATQTIEEVISPFLGKNMARASIRAHCTKLGLASDTLSQEELDSLVTALSKGLSVFVGLNKTREIVDTLHIRIKGKSVEAKP